MTAPSPSVPWWRDAVCYQVYVRSFADRNGDGVGDLPGVTSRLPYLAGLGVDAVWLTPFYRSPQADHGYDVADYRQVDPLFGTIEDFDDLLAAAHGLGLGVIVDVVPNHTSSAHAWFVAALAAPAGSPERARYVFRNGRGDGGVEPPNNWCSVFGGAAWKQVTDGQWYLHLFEESQPDLDWENPEVAEEFEAILRFWLDRGVDGFRIDVAHGMIKADGLPDVEGLDSAGESLDQVMADWDRPYWDQPRVHDIYRRWHRVLAAYPGDKMAIGEAWVDSAESMARYVRPDELQQVFNFHWLDAPWSARAFRGVIADTFAAVDPVGASPTWVLSNHDVTRTVTRYGDGVTGLARARAAVLTMLALPGSAYVYEGEELGLPQVEVAPEDRQDPTWLRGGGVGRDGCRVPIPWSGDRPPFGFGPDGTTTWLPQPVWFADLSVEVQERDPASTLSFFGEALACRRTLLPELGTRIEMLDRREDVVAFVRASAGDADRSDVPDGEDDVGGRGEDDVGGRGEDDVGGRGEDDADCSERGGGALVCVLNCGDTDHDVADLGEPLLTSAPVAADAPADGGVLPANTAAWFRTG